eukprot:Nitzschia sp. Nitz4//scaffold177_size45885//37495//38545//NITZ4_007212-RA/size45885-processed-gene-0.51-mRNA-1//-1//CDS//3329539076//4054//frame0
MLCRMINMLASVAFLGALAYLIWHFLGEPSKDDIKDALSDIDSWGDFTDVLGNLSGVEFGDLFDTDPFLSDNSTNSWPTSGSGGLELVLLNALDDTWQTEFVNAVDDWENGDPDALTLTIQQGEVDYSCTQVDGLQKVCNANFGETGWLGINELITATLTGEIQSSVAKMNEYYLLNADDDERQYTMCHEIGHGFGLPHTDESFTNPSLGNCMDYTNKPEENLHPDETNYQRLVSLYGTVDSRRGLRRSLSSTPLLSQELRDEYDAAVAEFSSTHRSLMESQDNSSWRLLREHQGGSVYTRRLGDLYTIEVHMLHTRE